MALAGRERGEGAERAPFKKMAAPWPPRSRPTVTSLPGRRRLSGAVRDKQKEAPEGRSGRRRDGAAGARCCRLGRPCAASPGRQLPWSKRNARTLPRQTWASLSTDSQHADSRAVHGEPLQILHLLGQTPDLTRLPIDPLRLPSESHKRTHDLSTQGPGFFFLFF